MALTTRDPHDQAILDLFSDLIRSSGPPDEHRAARVRAWVAADPAARLDYLGLNPAQAVAWHYATGAEPWFAAWKESR